MSINIMLLKQYTKTTLKLEQATDKQSEKCNLSNKVVHKN